MSAFYFTWLISLLLVDAILAVGCAYLSHAAFTVDWERFGWVLGIISGMLFYNLITIGFTIYLLIA